MFSDGHIMLFTSSVKDYKEQYMDNPNPHFERNKRRKEMSYRKSAKRSVNQMAFYYFN